MSLSSLASGIFFNRVVVGQTREAAPHLGADLHGGVPRAEGRGRRRADDAGGHRHRRLDAPTDGGRALPAQQVIPAMFSILLFPQPVIRLG